MVVAPWSRFGCCCLICTPRGSDTFRSHPVRGLPYSHRYHVLRLAEPGRAAGTDQSPEPALSDTGVVSPLPVHRKRCGRQVERRSGEDDPACLRGTFLCLVQAARRLCDGGRIVAISTTTLALKLSGYGIYNAAEGAIEAMVAVLAKEVGSRGIAAIALEAVRALRAEGRGARAASIRSR